MGSLVWEHGTEMLISRFNFRKLGESVSLCIFSGLAKCINDANNFTNIYKTGFKGNDVTICMTKRTFLGFNIQDIIWPF